MLPSSLFCTGYQLPIVLPITENTIKQNYLRGTKMKLFTNLAEVHALTSSTCLWMPMV